MASLENLRQSLDWNVDIASYQNPRPQVPRPKSRGFQCARLKLIFGSQSRNQVNTVRTRPLYRIIGAPEVVTPFEIGIGEVGHPLRVGCVGVRLITLCCRCLAHTRAETVGYLSVRLR